MIKLFTDTSANLPVHLTRFYGISVIPFSYTVDGAEQAADTEKDFCGTEFYAAMRAGADVKTSMISPALLEDNFKSALSNGDDVLFVCMSGGISGTAGAAKIVCEALSVEFPERKIHTVDTLGASMGEGLQVIAAAKMIRENADFETIVSHLETEKMTMCQYFTVDNLAYLQRGGRVGKAAAIVGTVFNIKPILTGNDEGKIVVFSKERGRRRVFEALAEKYSQKVRNLEEDIAIAHADDLDGAVMLKEMLRSRGFSGNCITVEYEPVTGSHVGPGTVALFFAGTEK